MSKSKPGNPSSRRDFLYSVTAGAAGAASVPDLLSAAPGTSRPNAAQPLLAGHADVYTQIMLLDGADWLIATDDTNQGREQKWFNGPRSDAVSIKVPGVMQLRFPDYHGVAWYWREFAAPPNPHAQGRYLLRFHLVDFLAEVWVNGIRVGRHEGGQGPFVFDATAAVKPGRGNRLAVRVLNPTFQPIDGLALRQLAEGRRDYPDPHDNAYNVGGIAGSVELLVAPALRIDDLFAMPDWKTGEVRVRLQVHNAGSAATAGRILLCAAPAVTGEPVAGITVEQSVPPGVHLVNATLRVANHRLWELDDPFLYRVTAGIEAAGTHSVDQRSARCGFRDLRFENGYYRFNGRRIYLHGCLYTVLQYPIEQIIPVEEEWLRRDVLYAKTLGFNAVRVTCGPSLPRQLDLFDELGVMVMEEHFGARVVEDSPQLNQRWDQSIGSVIRRDRNHPSITLWCLLNEVRNGALFHHTVKSLQTLRDLDETRIVLIGSGRFDKDYSVGSFSNPGSRRWESGLRDVHAYPTFPHTAEIIAHMRSPQLTGKMPGVSEGISAPGPFLLSEYGVCSGQDYARFVRHFEMLGDDTAVDGRLFRAKLERFMVDWKKWSLSECWARPEDYFADSQRNQSRLALGDYNVWLTNPALVGDMTSTQIPDAWFHGCGISNYFRELKPGMTDAFTDMAYKTRWSLLVEPANACAGSTVKLEAVLVNHDDNLKPGKLPVRLQVVGPRCTSLLDKNIEVEIKGTENGNEPPYVMPVFAQDLTVDGPTGKYKFLATFEHGVAAGGGKAEFFVARQADLPPVNHEVTLWGQDEELRAWLTKQGFRVRAFDAVSPGKREVILASGAPPAPGGAAAFAELARRMATGSGVVFLTYATLVESGAPEKPPTPLRWAPFPADARPSLVTFPIWYFRADHWAKEHPIFHGLPSGGVMDYLFYRDILGNKAMAGLKPPLEAVSGALDTSIQYQSDLLVSVHEFGAGRFALNTHKIRESLGRDPAAEHLLRNLLNYVARDADKPPAPLPQDFDQQLSALGYV